jgi:hypothetical protein
MSSTAIPPPGEVVVEGEYEVAMQDQARWNGVRPGDP